MITLYTNKNDKTTSLVTYCDRCGKRSENTEIAPLLCDKCQKDILYWLGPYAAEDRGEKLEDPCWDCLTNFY